MTLASPHDNDMTAACDSAYGQMGTCTLYKATHEKRLFVQESHR